MSERPTCQFSGSSLFPATGSGGEPARASRDVTLLANVAAGDQAAFTLFHARHRAAVALAVRAILGPEADAEDVAQEAFIALWRQAESYRPEMGTPLAWVVTIARHRAIDVRRAKERRRVGLLEAGRLDTTAEPVEARAEEIRGDEEKLRQALTQLDESHRQVIDLAFFGTRSHAEIAAALDMPLGTVKARIRRGLLRLRRRTRSKV